MNELHQDKFLFHPFSDDIKYPSKEEHRKGEWYDRSKYRFGDAMLPGKSMQKHKKEKPCTGEECPEGIYGESKNLNGGIHEQYLKVKS